MLVGLGQTVEPAFPQAAHAAVTQVVVVGGLRGSVQRHPHRRRGAGPRAAPPAPVLVHHMKLSVIRS